MHVPITFEVREVYGRLLLYPLDAVAQALCDFKKRTALGVADIEVLKRAGFTLVIRQKDVSSCIPLKETA